MKNSLKCLINIGIAKGNIIIIIKSYYLILLKKNNN